MTEFCNDTFPPSLLRGKTQTIFGVLNPIMWDRRGKVKKFSIYSSEDEDIIIEGYRNRHKLKALLNRRVEAQGLIRMNDDGEKIIRLNQIKEITGPNSPAMMSPSNLDSSIWNEEFSVSIPRKYALSQYQYFQSDILEAC